MEESFIEKQKRLYRELGWFKYAWSKLNSDVKGYWVVIALLAPIILGLIF